MNADKLLTKTPRAVEPQAKVYQHTVLCQTSLPYRPTDARTWERRQGNVAMLIEAGHAKKEGEWVKLPLPHGEKPRLILTHLNAEAMRTGSPVVEVERSLKAFIRKVGIDTNGPHMDATKDQLARLATATVRFVVNEEGQGVQVNTQFVSAFAYDLWSKDERHRVPWPTTVRLSADYFDSLTRHAVPLSEWAVKQLKGSALALDVYCWMAQRLHRVPPGRAQHVSWEALREQFGTGYKQARDFRPRFRAVLRQVLDAYQSARVEVAEHGLLLFHSPPPVPKRLVQGRTG